MLYVIAEIFFFPVYATTAANPEENTWACHYDKRRKTFLGDVYSVNWMENSDAVRVIAYFSFYTCSAEFSPICPSKVVRSFSNGNSGPRISRWTSVCLTLYRFAGWSYKGDTHGAIQNCERRDEEQWSDAVWRHGIFNLYLTIEIVDSRGRRVVNAVEDSVYSWSEDPSSSPGWATFWFSTVRL